jgi:ankyrin repeat protein
VLDELPETLDETYERTLREINKADWELAHRLFQCVAVASRPFRIEELAEFLAFDFQAGPIPKFREDWRTEDPIGVVLSTCTTLLSLGDDHGSQVIQFSHFSVKEFLTSTRFAKRYDTISSRYNISMTHAHTIVVQACLGMLLHLDDNITRDGLKTFPLAEYAAEHWFNHACFEGVSENAEECMKQLFDASKRHLAVWVWIKDPVRPWRSHRQTERPSIPRETSLHYAAFCGLHLIVKFLAIKHPQDLHSQHFDNKLTPLHLASQMGHVEVARLLIEQGANATVKGKDGITPLHLATREQRIDLVRLLVEQGADVAAKDNDERTPLHFAVREGSVDLARLLIEHGADVTAKDNARLTPLHFAIWEGSVDLTRLLIEHGADVSTEDIDGLTPLRLAMREGYADLARLLIEQGAGMTTKDNDNMTSLQWAEWDPSVDFKFADLPVDHGTSMATKDIGGLLATQLQLAVREGNVDIVRLLVEHGADITTVDIDGFTPLHWAVREENVDLARLLVGHGADTTAEDIDGLTPLQLAAEKGSLDLVRLLAEHDAQYKRDPFRRIGHRFLELWQSITSSSTTQLGA